MVWITSASDFAAALRRASLLTTKDSKSVEFDVVVIHMVGNTNDSIADLDVAMHNLMPVGIDTSHVDAFAGVF